MFTIFLSFSIASSGFFFINTSCGVVWVENHCFRLKPISSTAPATVKMPLTWSKES